MSCRSQMLILSIKPRAGIDGAGRRVLALQRRDPGLAALRSEVLASSRRVIDVDDPSGSTRSIHRELESDVLRSVR